MLRGHQKYPVIQFYPHTLFKPYVRTNLAKKLLLARTPTKLKFPTFPDSLKEPKDEGNPVQCGKRWAQLSIFFILSFNKILKFNRQVFHEEQFFEI